MKALSKTLLVLYLILLIWLVLFKFSVNLSSISDQLRSLNLIPLANYSQGSLKDMLDNFIVFIPFGLLLSINMKRLNLWEKLAIILTFSVAFEIIQFIFAIGASDITDVITNTLGGLVGLGLYELLKAHIDKEILDRYIIVVGTILLTLSILILGFFILKGTRFHSAPPVEVHQAQVQ